MRKMILAVVNLLLLLYVITHFVSLRQYGEMRTLMGRFPSDELLVGVSWPFAINQDGMYEGLTLAQEEINRVTLRETHPVAHARRRHG